MNPFLYGTIVRGGNFFDRKEESATIIKTLSGGNNMVLFAPRRFGKTSLVYHVIDQLEKQDCICLYFDFMPVYSVESFVRLYAKALAAKQTNIQKFAQVFSSVIKNIRPAVNFTADGGTEFSLDFADTVVDETIVAHLLDMTESLAGAKKRTLVFFDEFQEAEKLNSINFENLLRSKIQQQTKTNYLFFGSKTHVLNELFNSKKRAFYQSAYQMTIGPLPEKETIAFLQKNFKASNIALDAAAARYLIAAAGNIPHYVQLLASEVWQYLVSSKKSVTKTAVDVCAKRLLALKSDYYMELFDRQSQSKKQLLQALTKNGKNIFSAAYMSAARFKTIATLQRAARELVSDGVVEKTNDEYFITDPFFKLFVAATLQVDCR
jgi:AAA+ ATPase superfamily predicted ATPase